VPWSGATDCPVCHQTVSGAPGPHTSKLFSFGFLQRRSAIIHRTVRYTSGATVPSRNGRLHSAVTTLQYATEVRTKVRGASDSEQYMFGAAPDCPVPLEDKASNGCLCQNPNGWGSWLAHRTVWCAHRQQPSPTVVLVVGAINTPQPPPLQLSMHSTHCIQYKSNRLHSKDTIQVIDPLKVPASTLAH
jgi:hypothetical protein